MVYTWPFSRGRVPPNFDTPGVGSLQLIYSHGELCLTYFKIQVSRNLQNYATVNKCKIPANSAITEV